jgi:hypothetical protein
LNDPQVAASRERTVALLGIIEATVMPEIGKLRSSKSASSIPILLGGFPERNGLFDSEKKLRPM